MDMTQIISTVLWGLSVMGYIVLALLAIIRKCRGKKTENSAIDKVENVVLSVLGEISNVETLYNSVFKDGIKAGSFKLRDVLDLAEKECNKMGIPFNTELWTDLVNSVIDTLNNITPNYVQSTVHEDNKIIYKEVNQK